MFLHFFSANLHRKRFKVFMAVKLWIVVFWITMPHILPDCHQYFRGTENGDYTALTDKTTIHDSCTGRVQGSNLISGSAQSRLQLEKVGMLQSNSTLHSPVENRTITIGLE
jgi:hypothetical protein